MSFSFKAKSGINFVPAYQISGVPYLTSSVSGEVKGVGAGNKPTTVEFPHVTRNIKIRNTGPSELRVAFTFSGSYSPGETVTGGGTKSAAQSANYFLIPTGSGPSQSHDNSVQDFDFRCKKLFFVSNTSTATSFSLAAGLTGIAASELPVLTASNGFEGVG
jgi:hypothetical protein